MKTVLPFALGVVSTVLALTMYQALALTSRADDVARYRAYTACKAAAVNDVVTFKCLELNPFYHG